MNCLSSTELADDVLNRFNLDSPEFLINLFTETINAVSDLCGLVSRAARLEVSWHISCCATEASSNAADAAVRKSEVLQPDQPIRTGRGASTNQRDFVGKSKGISKNYEKIKI